MPDSTINLFIKHGEKPVISVRDLEEKGEKHRGARADIFIDQPTLHFTLSLPKFFLRVLVEKIQELLDEMEAEVKEQTESEETSVHAQKDRKEIKEKILLGGL